MTSASSPTFPNPTGSTTVLTLTNMLGLSNKLAPTPKIAPSSGPPNFVILSSCGPPTQNAQNTLYAALPVSSGEQTYSVVGNDNNRQPLIGLRTAPTELRIHPKTPRDQVAASPHNGTHSNDYYGTQNSGGDRRGHHSSRRGASSDRAGKGLRHFSMKVCEKVHRKGVTTYNEVADELVSEYALQFPSTPPGSYEYHSHHHHGHLDGGFGVQAGTYDHKNIRRRVYDALNVLMAMNIISKEKKEIRWIGLPTNSHQEFHNLEKEKQKRIERIKEKQTELNNLLLKQIALKNLIDKNRRDKLNGISEGITNGFKPEFKTLGPAGSSPPQRPLDQNQPGLYLPFILINTEKSTEIDCSISNDKCEYYFNFNNHFEVDDDFQILKKLDLTMGLDRGKPIDPSVLNRALNMVPPVMHPYVKALANGSTNLDLPTPQTPYAVDKPINELAQPIDGHGPKLISAPPTTAMLVSPSTFMTPGGPTKMAPNSNNNANSVRPTQGGAINSFTNGSLATLQFKNFITAKNLIASLSKSPPTLTVHNSVGNNGNARPLAMQNTFPHDNAASLGHEDKGGSSTSTSDIYTSDDSNGSQSNSSSLNSLRP